MSFDAVGLLDRLEMSVAVYRLDGTCVYANHNTLRLFGVSAERLVGARLWDVFPDAVGNQFHQAFVRVAETRIPESFCHYYAPFDGWYDNQILENGGHIHVIAVDVTLQKRAERRLAALADSSQAFAGAMDPQRAFEIVARALAEHIGDACEICLLKASGQSGQVLDSVAVHHADRRDTPKSIAALPIEAARGLTARVCSNGDELFIPELDRRVDGEVSKHEAYETMIASVGAHSLMAVPLRDDRRVIGLVLMTRDRTARPYATEDFDLLRDLAARAASMLARVRLHEDNVRALEAERNARVAAEQAAEQARRVADQTRCLQVVSAQLSRRLSSREIAETVVRESASVVRGTTAAIWLLDERREQLELFAQFGYDARQPALLPVHVETPLTEAVRTGQPVYLDTHEQYRARFPESFARMRLDEEHPASFATACLPLRAEGPVIGGIAFAFWSQSGVADDQRAFLEVLANHAAQALDRARLQEQERAATEALAETNRTLQAIISASPAAIMLLDLDGTVRLWNPAAERIFGWTASDVLGRLLPTIDDAVRAEFHANLARVARGEPVVGAETKRHTKARGIIDVGLYAAPVVHPDGTVQCLSVVVDITDRKSAEDAAREADRRKDEFLAMLGHELRNPLAPLKTALQLLELRSDAAIERERAVIQRQVAHLQRLVDDLLDVSRITRGKISLERAPVELSQIVADALDIVAPILDQRRHRLRVDVPATGLVVDGDRVRLTQVVSNILNNAAKYTGPEGEVRVAAGREINGSVALRIIDNGVGISAEMLPQVFEMFVQERQAIDRSLGGLGLGLAIARSLVTMHGGEITAHSKGIGQGSEFVVRLPEAQPTNDSATARPSNESHAAIAALRVLIIDDNSDAVEMIASFLELEGMSTRRAYDGPSGIDLARAYRPQFVLLDIGLPVMDGFEVATRLRAMPETKAAWIAAVTGYGQPDDRARTKAAGFDAHLVKPIDMRDLVEMLNTKGAQMMG